MKDINFEVISAEAANKTGYTVVKVKFNNSPKEFTYVRKAWEDGRSVTIDGCKITLNLNYEVVSIDRLYDTKGIKKLTSSGKTTKEKIKNEIIEKKITLPKVKIPKFEITKDGEVKHEKYEEIKMCLENNIPIYLAGPAGSGKNFTVEQIAKELDWNFYFTNSVQQEFKLTGFIDAGGKFHETEFYKACVDDKDCIFFLDEMDASIPEVLVLLNAAIANGYFEFPNGKVNLENVHFVSAGNTVGSGADDMYTGRMVLDQATLDRFVIIEFDYSLGIELSLAKGNTELVDFIHQLRKESNYKGVRATFSYRCITMTIKLENAGMNLQTIMKIAIVKGLDKDTINTLYINGSSKYHKALKELQMAA